MKIFFRFKWRQAVSKKTGTSKKDDPRLKEKARGRRSGGKRQLTQEQEKEIRSILTSHPPEQMELGSALWTCAAVCQLIQEKYGSNVTLRTVGEYLKRWGMAGQHPATKVLFRDNVKLDAFMYEMYPVIVEQARREDAVIFWGDETRISDQSCHVRRHILKKRRPRVLPLSKEEKITMISSISNQGTCRFLCYRGTVTQQCFIDFMERLVKDSDRKVLLIASDLKAHCGKIAAGWLSEHKDELELFLME